MDNPIPARQNSIHRYHIFGIVVGYGIISAKFPLYGFFAGKQICRLDIHFFFSTPGYKIHFSFVGFSYIDLISSGNQFVITDGFDNIVKLFFYTVLFDITTLNRYL